MKNKKGISKEKILATYESNNSIRETSRILKVNRRTVNEVIDKAFGKYKSMNLTDEEHEKIIEDLKGSNYSKDYLCKKYDVGEYIVERYYNAYVKKDNRQRSVRHGNHIYNENCFEEIDTEEKAYWLGFLLADGNMDLRRNRVSLEIGQIDIDHLKKLKLFYDCDYNISTRERNGHTTASLRVSSKKMIKDLLRIGFVPNKTYEMKSIIEKIPKDLRIHFLRGLFDGDGGLTASKANDCNIYLSGLHKIVKDFTDYFNIDKNRISKREVTGEKRKYDYHARVNLGGNRQCMRILDELYEDANIYLNRKYKKYKDHFEGYSYRQPSNNYRE